MPEQAVAWGSVCLQHLLWASVLPAQHQSPRALPAATGACSVLCVCPQQSACFCWGILPQTPRSSLCGHSAVASVHCLQLGTEEGRTSSNLIVNQLDKWTHGHVLAKHFSSYPHFLLSPSPQSPTWCWLSLGSLVRWTVQQYSSPFLSWPWWWRVSVWHSVFSSLIWSSWIPSKS